MYHAEGYFHFVTAILDARHNSHFFCVLALQTNESSALPGLDFILPPSILFHGHLELSD